MNKSLNWYLCYKNKYYDVGTKVKMKTRYRGIIITTFLGGNNYQGLSKYCFASNMPPEHYILEIVEPVYYTPPKIDHTKKANIFTRTGSGSWQSHDEVVTGLILYIFIMLIGTIFKDRFFIWTAATIIFFLWKKTK